MPPHPFLIALLATAAFGGVPDTPKRPVVDTYHEVAVTDDYRWLEDWSQPEVRRWSEAQSEHARAVLDALPGVSGIRARVTEIMSAPTVHYSAPAFRGGRLFLSLQRPPKEQPVIAVLDSPDAPDSARVVFDPARLDAKGTTSFDWFLPSPDGKLVAVSVSRGGSESGDVHVHDVSTGEGVFEVIPRVNGGTAGGGLAWAPDSSGFYYTRYPRGGERPPEDMDFYVRVYFHALGTPTERDRYEMGDDLPRIAEIALDAEEGGAKVLASVQKGDGGEFSHHVRMEDGRWVRISRFEDGIVQAAFGPANHLYLVSRKDAPRGKVLRLRLDHPTLSDATTLIPECGEAIVSDFLDPEVLLATASRLHVKYQLGGPSEFRIFDLQGKRLSGPRFLPCSAVSIGTELRGDDILFGMASYIEPFAWYSFEAGSGVTRRTGLAEDPPVSFSDCDLERTFATSRDGTRVPLSIVHPRGIQLDGDRPCILTGYGGFGISVEPRFSAVRHVLMEQGVIFAQGNLRGGGEFGEEWHRQGNLTRKQNVFDDFVACARHLIDRRYTNPRRLAIIGGSNGGLLMGAALTQHPELFRCVVAEVGIYDMLRVERSANGAFNTTEYGSVKDEAQFRALYAYSPYHHVVDGTAYPGVLFLTGANDPRVDPMQSRKMTARLQAAGANALLRTSATSGHGIGTALSERIEEQVDIDAFIFARLGVTFRPWKPAR